jgi:hypothetical protein
MEITNRSSLTRRIQEDGDMHATYTSYLVAADLAELAIESGKAAGWNSLSSPRYGVVLFDGSMTYRLPSGGWLAMVQVPRAEVIETATALGWVIDDGNHIITPSRTMIVIWEDPSEQDAFPLVTLTSRRVDDRRRQADTRRSPTEADGASLETEVSPADHEGPLPPGEAIVDCGPANVFVHRWE